MENNRIKLDVNALVEQYELQVNQLNRDLIYNKTYISQLEKRLASLEAELKSLKGNKNDVKDFQMLEAVEGEVLQEVKEVK